MFLKKNRFSFKKGIPRHLIKSHYFVVRYEEKGDKDYKIAVVVGKKVDKKAVVRNKIKRALVKSLKSFLSDKKNINIVIYARKPILDLSSDQMAIEIEKVLKNIKVI